MSKPLNDLVKPDLREKWDSEIYPKYFVRDQKDIDQQRQPGLFKEEAVIKNGSMVCLRTVSNSFNIIII